MAGHVPRFRRLQGRRRLGRHHLQLREPWSRRGSHPRRPRLVRLHHPGLHQDPRRCRRHRHSQREIQPHGASRPLLQERHRRHRRRPAHAPGNQRRCNRFEQHPALALPYRTRRDEAPHHPAPLRHRHQGEGQSRLPRGLQRLGRAYDSLLERPAPLHPHRHLRRRHYPRRRAGRLRPYAHPLADRTLRHPHRLCVHRPLGRSRAD